MNNLSLSPAHNPNSKEVESAESIYFNCIQCAKDDLQKYQKKITDYLNKKRIFFSLNINKGKDQIEKQEINLKKLKEILDKKPENESKNLTFDVVHAIKSAFDEAANLTTNNFKEYQKNHNDKNMENSTTLKMLGKQKNKFEKYSLEVARIIQSMSSEKLYKNEIKNLKDENKELTDKNKELTDDKEAHLKNEKSLGKEIKKLQNRLDFHDKPLRKEVYNMQIKPFIDHGKLTPKNFENIKPRRYAPLSSRDTRFHYCDEVKNIENDLQNVNKQIIEKMKEYGYGSEVNEFLANFSLPQKFLNLSLMEKFFPEFANLQPGGEHGFGLSFTDDEILEFHSPDRFSPEESILHIIDGKSVILQQATRGCTAAVACMLICDHNNHQLTKAMQKSLESTNLGKDVLINDLITKNGLTPVTTPFEEIEELKQLLKQNGPAIISVSGGVGGHVIIVDEITEEGVTIRDPAHGWSITVDINAFQKATGQKNRAIQINKD